MKDLYQQIIEEHPDIDKKVLSRFLKSFESLDIKLKSEFFSSLKKKLSHKVRQVDEKNYLEQLQLIPSKIKFRYRLAGFAAAVFVFLFIFIIAFLADFSDQLLIPSKYIEVEGLIIQKEESLKGWMGEVIFTDAILLSREGEDESYLYDGKKYPKIPVEMPVYKHSWSLVNEDLLAKNLGGLKFGDISLKNFKEMTLSHLMIRSEIDPQAYVEVDVESGVFSIVDFVIEKEITDKNIISTVESFLKSFNISLKDYGKPWLVWFSEDSAEVFYPLLLHGKYPVWNVDYNWPLGVVVRYDALSRRISVSGIDIARYIYTNYPTLSKDEVLRDFSVGIKKLNTPEVVYLAKYIGDQLYYLPGLRFVINEEKALYKELVNF